MLRIVQSLSLQQKMAPQLIQSLQLLQMSTLQLELEIKQQLESRVLITKVASPAGSVWRTRMAETVRLLARLRQLFPQHMNNG